MFTVDDFVARARSTIGRGVKYRLGAGGMDQRSESPGNVNNECDCSGFVCWALGISRQTDHPLYVRFNGGWISTDAMVHDAQAATGFFVQLAAPRVGCIVVYGSKPPARKVGHVGIVTEVANDLQTSRAVKVLHCSHANERRGNAISETDFACFKKPDAILAWFEGLG